MKGALHYLIEFKSLSPTWFWALLAMIIIISFLIVRVFRLSAKKNKKQFFGGNWWSGKVEPSASAHEDAPDRVPSEDPTVHGTREGREIIGEKGKTGYKYEDKKHPYKKDKIEALGEGRGEKEKNTDVNNGSISEPPVMQKSSITTLLYVNYNCSLAANTESYPILRIPKEGCIIRTHRIGSTKRRGYKEADFQQAIKNYFAGYFEILGNARINIGRNTRPFEPDISLISKTSQLNIRIDVEIDEPYAGISRKATHCKGDDYHRDTYFTDRGWVVIRFSEYQIHAQEGQCLKFIGKIIKSIDENFQIPANLEKLDDIMPEPCWDILQAQKWEKQKYRENYLGHEFLSVTECQETVARDLNAQEKAEENEVKPSLPRIMETGRNLSFNKENQHNRDGRIKFFPEEHVYIVDNKPVPSASALISRFFPEFDLEYWAEKKSFELGKTAAEVALSWKKNGMEAANLGKRLHQQVENYYLDLPYEEVPEFAYFKSFAKDHEALLPFRSEWRVFDDEYGFAGTIDLVAKNVDGFEIFDWKRSKRVLDDTLSPIVNNPYGAGVGVLSHMPDTPYNRYIIQQNLYKHILEENYGIKVNAMHLVILHPRYRTYHKLQLPVLNDEVNAIISSI